MPDPMLLALVHVLILEKEWTFSAKKWNEPPEEEESEGVEGPQSDEATKDDNKFVVWQFAIVELHSNQKLVGT